MNKVFLTVAKFAKQAHRRQNVRVSQFTVALRPPLNKKSFPVHRPGGLKRADWDVFFFSIFLVHSSQ